MIRTQIQLEESPGRAAATPRRRGGHLALGGRSAGGRSLLACTASGSSARGPRPGRLARGALPLGTRRSRDRSRPLPRRRLSGVIFLDTSGLLAVLDPPRCDTPQATRAWREILDGPRGSGHDELRLSSDRARATPARPLRRRRPREAIGARRERRVGRRGAAPFRQRRAARRAPPRAESRRLRELRGHAPARHPHGVRPRPALRRAGVYAGARLASPAEEVHEDPGMAPPAP